MPFAHYCLLFAVLSGAGALANPPPPASAAAGAPPGSPIVAPVEVSHASPTGNVSPVGKTSGKPRADEDLMEFLGEDDVGDAAWEFLKNSAPHKPAPSAASQQDAKS